MSIIVKKHMENLKKHYYVATIKDNGETIVDAKNLGCETTESGELDTVELRRRIKHLVVSHRTKKANVDIDFE